MRKVLAVAWREFEATALTRAFIIVAVFVPLLMIGLAVLGPMVFNPRPLPLEGMVAIIDSAGAFAAAARVEFDPERIRERVRERAREEAEKKPTASPEEAMKSANA